MDDFDNDHESSSDGEHEQQEQDDAQALEDAENREDEEDDEFNEDDDDQDDDGDNDDQDHDHDHDHDADQDHDHEPDHSEDHHHPDDHDHTTHIDAPPPPRSGSTSLASPSTPAFRPRVRPEALSARLYDIVPTMAAPQATSINAMAITPDLRYWMTGGTDGYVRKYDGPGTINGRQLLTVAQRHPFVDSVVKAGILMGYWENLEPPAAGKAAQNNSDDKVRSPVYALAVHKDALWSMAGLESGGINIHSVRHDEGKVIYNMPAKSADRDGHANAVSVLQLTPEEQNVLSGSWDKRVLDWDLNKGTVAATFEGSGGQISAIELRPLSGAPVPAEAAEEPASETFTSSSRPTGFFSNGLDGDAQGNGAVAGAPAADAVGDGPAGSDNESLFGSPGGSLFGEGQMGGGGNAFGGDDDNEFSHAMLEPLEDAPGDGLGDTAMPDAPPLPPPAPPAAAQPIKPEPEAASQTPDHLQPPSTDPPPPFQKRPASSHTVTSQPLTMHSPTLVFNPPTTTTDPTVLSSTTFLTASIDGTLRLWDRRTPTPLARIATRLGVPPWCMGACWSPSGNHIYAGRRNGTVEEFSIHKASSAWTPERTLRFPQGSGAVSAVRAMPNGRHLVCASHDILRLYDLQAETGGGRGWKGGNVPFLIIPGPPRAGVISQLYVDPSARFMVTAAGTRGWEGSCTETIVGYEIGCIASIESEE